MSHSIQMGGACIASDQDLCLLLNTKLRSLSRYKQLCLCGAGGRITVGQGSVWISPLNRIVCADILEVTIKLRLISSQGRGTQPSLLEDQGYSHGGWVWWEMRLTSRQGQLKGLDLTLSILRSHWRVLSTGMRRLMFPKATSACWVVNEWKW